MATYDDFKQYRQAKESGNLDEYRAEKAASNQPSSSQQKKFVDNPGFSQNFISQFAEVKKANDEGWIQRVEESRRNPINKRETTVLEDVLIGLNDFGEAIADPVGFGQSWAEFKEDPSVGGFAEAAVKFVPTVIGGMASIPFTTPASLAEISSGVDLSNAEDGMVSTKSLTDEQRAAELGYVAIDLLGLGAGGSGAFLKGMRSAGEAAEIGAKAEKAVNAAESMTKPQKSLLGGSQVETGAMKTQLKTDERIGKAATMAKEGVTDSDGKHNWLFDMGEEAGEEFIQTGLEDVRNEQVDEGTLGRMLESAAFGAAGGGLLHAASWGLGKLGERIEKDNKERADKAAQVASETRRGALSEVFSEMLGNKEFSGVGIPLGANRQFDIVGRAEKKIDQRLGKQRGKNAQIGTAIALGSGVSERGYTSGSVISWVNAANDQESLDNRARVVYRNFNVADTGMSEEKFLGMIEGERTKEERSQICALLNEGLEKGAKRGKYLVTYENREPRTNNGPFKSVVTKVIDEANNINFESDVDMQLMGGDFDGDMTSISYVLGGFDNMGFGIQNLIQHLDRQATVEAENGETEQVIEIADQSNVAWGDLGFSYANFAMWADEWGGLQDAALEKGSSREEVKKADEARQVIKDNVVDPLIAEATTTVVDGNETVEARPDTKRREISDNVTDLIIKAYRRIYFNLQKLNKRLENGDIDTDEYKRLCDLEVSQTITSLYYSTSSGVKILYDPEGNISFETEKDSNGNPLKDENGNVVYKKDAEGHKIVAYTDKSVTREEAALITSRFVRGLVTCFGRTKDLVQISETLSNQISDQEAAEIDAMLDQTKQEFEVGGKRIERKETNYRYAAGAMYSSAPTVFGYTDFLRTGKDKAPNEPFRMVLGLMMKARNLAVEYGQAGVEKAMDVIGKIFSSALNLGGVGQDQINSYFSAIADAILPQCPLYGRKFTGSSATDESYVMDVANWIIHTHDVAAKRQREFVKALPIGEGYQNQLKINDILAPDMAVDFNDPAFCESLAKAIINLDGDVTVGNIFAVSDPKLATMSIQQVAMDRLCGIEHSGMPQSTFFNAFVRVAEQRISGQESVVASRAAELCSDNGPIARMKTELERVRSEIAKGNKDVSFSSAFFMDLRAIGSEFGAWVDGEVLLMAEMIRPTDLIENPAFVKAIEATNEYERTEAFLSFVGSIAYQGNTFVARGYMSEINTLIGYDEETGTIGDGSIPEENYSKISKNALCAAVSLATKNGNPVYEYVSDLLNALHEACEKTDTIEREKEVRQIFSALSRFDLVMQGKVDGISVANEKFSETIKMGLGVDTAIKVPNFSIWFYCLCGTRNGLTQLGLGTKVAFGQSFASKKSAQQYHEELTAQVSAAAESSDFCAKSTISVAFRNLAAQKFTKINKKVFQNAILNALDVWNFMKEKTTSGLFHVIADAINLYSNSRYVDFMEEFNSQLNGRYSFDYVMNNPQLMTMILGNPDVSIEVFDYRSGKKATLNREAVFRIYGVETGTGTDPTNAAWIELFQKNPAFSSLLTPLEVVSSVGKDGIGVSFSGDTNESIESRTDALIVQQPIEPLDQLREDVKVQIFSDPKLAGSLAMYLQNILTSGSKSYDDMRKDIDKAVDDFVDLICIMARDSVQADKSSAMAAFTLRQNMKTKMVRRLYDGLAKANRSNVDLLNMNSVYALYQQALSMIKYEIALQYCEDNNLKFYNDDDYVLNTNSRLFANTRIWYRVLQMYLNIETDDITSIRKQLEEQGLSVIDSNGVEHVLSNDEIESYFDDKKYLLGHEKVDSLATYGHNGIADFPNMTQSARYNAICEICRYYAIPEPSEDLALLSTLYGPKSQRATKEEFLASFKEDFMEQYVIPEIIKQINLIDNTGLEMLNPNMFDRVDEFVGIVQKVASKYADRLVSDADEGNSKTNAAEKEFAAEMLRTLGGYSGKYSNKDPEHMSELENNAFAAIINNLFTSASTEAMTSSRGKTPKYTRILPAIGHIPLSIASVARGVNGFVQFFESRNPQRYAIMADENLAKLTEALTNLDDSVLSALDDDQLKIAAEIPNMLKPKGGRPYVTLGREDCIYLQTIYQLAFPADKAAKSEEIQLIIADVDDVLSDPKNWKKIIELMVESDTIKMKKMIDELASTTRTQRPGSLETLYGTPAKSWNPGESLVTQVLEDRIQFLDRLKQAVTEHLDETGNSKKPLLASSDFNYMVRLFCPYVRIEYNVTNSETNKIELKTAMVSFYALSKEGAFVTEVDGVKITIDENSIQAYSIYCLNTQELCNTLINEGVDYIRNNTDAEGNYPSNEDLKNFLTQRFVLGMHEGFQEEMSDTELRLTLDSMAPVSRKVQYEAEPQLMYSFTDALDAKEGVSWLSEMRGEMSVDKYAMNAQDTMTEEERKTYRTNLENIIKTEVTADNAPILGQKQLSSVYHYAKISDASGEIDIETLGKHRTPQDSQPYILMKLDDSTRNVNPSEMWKLIVEAYKLGKTIRIIYAPALNLDASVGNIKAQIVDCFYGDSEESKKAKAKVAKAIDVASIYRRGEYDWKHLNKHIIEIQPELLMRHLSRNRYIEPNLVQRMTGVSDDDKYPLQLVFEKEDSPFVFTDSGILSFGLEVEGNRRYGNLDLRPHIKDGVDLEGAAFLHDGHKDSMSIEQATAISEVEDRLKEQLGSALMESTEKNANGSNKPISLDNFEIVVPNTTLSGNDAGIARQILNFLNSPETNRQIIDKNKVYGLFYVPMLFNAEKPKIIVLMDAKSDSMEDVAYGIDRSTQRIWTTFTMPMGPTMTKPTKYAAVEGERKGEDINYPYSAFLSSTGDVSEIRDSDNVVHMRVQFAWGADTINSTQAKDGMIRRRENLFTLFELTRKTRMYNAFDAADDQVSLRIPERVKMTLQQESRDPEAFSEGALAAFTTYDSKRDLNMMPGSRRYHFWETMLANINDSELVLIPQSAIGLNGSDVRNAVATVIRACLKLNIDPMIFLSNSYYSSKKGQLTKCEEVYAEIASVLHYLDYGDTLVTLNQMFDPNFLNMYAIDNTYGNHDVYLSSGSYFYNPVTREHENGRKKVRVMISDMAIPSDAARVTNSTGGSVGNMSVQGGPADANFEHGNGAEAVLAMAADDGYRATEYYREKLRRAYDENESEDFDSFASFNGRRFTDEADTTMQGRRAQNIVELCNKYKISRIKEKQKQWWDNPHNYVVLKDMAQESDVTGGRSSGENEPMLVSEVENIIKRVLAGCIKDGVEIRVEDVMPLIAARIGWYRTGDNENGATSPMPYDVFMEGLKLLKHDFETGYAEFGPQLVSMPDGSSRFTYGVGTSQMAEYIARTFNIKNADKMDVWTLKGHILSTWKTTIAKETPEGLKQVDVFIRSHVSAYNAWLYFKLDLDKEAPTLFGYPYLETIEGPIRDAIHVLYGADATQDWIDEIVERDKKFLNDFASHDGIIEAHVDSRTGKTYLVRKNKTDGTIAKGLSHAVVASQTMSLLTPEMPVMNAIQVGLGVGKMDLIFRLSDTGYGPLLTLSEGEKFSNGFREEVKRDPAAKKFFTALMLASVKGETNAFLRDINSNPDFSIDEYIKSGYSDKLGSKIVHWIFRIATASDVLRAKKIDLFLDALPRMLKENGRVDLLAPYPGYVTESGETISTLEGQLMNQPVITRLTNIFSGAGNLGTANVAWTTYNLCQVADMAQLTLPAAVFEQIAENNAWVRFGMATFGCKFFRATMNYSGRVLNWVAPLSAFHYLTTEWLMSDKPKAKAMRQMFGLNDANGNILASFKAQEDMIKQWPSLAAALKYDMIKMGVGAVATIVAGSMFLEPPDDEDKWCDYEEWTFMGQRIATQWWLQDTLSVALPLACFWKAAELGRPMPSIVSLGFGQACFNNPFLRATDMIAAVCSPDDISHDFETAAEAYADAPGGPPDGWEYALANLEGASLTYLSQFVTPRFLNELYQVIGQDYERSYNRQFRTSDTGMINEEGLEGETERVDFRTAQIRKISRNNIFIATVENIIHGTFFDENGYFASQMPYTLYSDDAQIDFMKRFSVNDPETGERKSDQEVNTICYGLLQALAETTDPANLYAEGWYLDYDTKSALSEFIWDLYYDTKATYNQMKGEGYLDYYVLGNGDYMLGRQLASEYYQAYQDQLQYYYDLYQKLWSSELNQGFMQYKRYKTTYAQDADGNYYATGFEKGLGGLFAPLQYAPQQGTAGYKEDWASVSAVTGEAMYDENGNALRALVPLTADYMDTPDFESWSKNGDGNGYSATYASRNGDPLAKTYGFSDTDTDSSSGNSSKSYGGGGYSRSYSRGGGGYSPSIYSRVSVPYGSTARTMNADRLYHRNYDYLRPGFETKGSREASKRQDI